MCAYKKPNSQTAGHVEGYPHLQADETGMPANCADLQTALETYDWKPLPPLPLNLSGKGFPTSERCELHPVTVSNHRAPYLTSGAETCSLVSRYPVRTNYTMDLNPNLDPKNKPLPLESSDACSAQQQFRSASKLGERGAEEPFTLRPVPFTASKPPIDCLELGHTADQGDINCFYDSEDTETSKIGPQMNHRGQRDDPHRNISTRIALAQCAKQPSHSRSASGSQGDFLPPCDDGTGCTEYDRTPTLQSLAAKATEALRPGAKCPALCSIPRPIGIEELHGDKLLAVFFGFDFMGQIRPLSGVRLHHVRHLLTTQPHPDTRVNDVRHPIFSCVWLRNFIVNAPNRLEIDRGRLRGLRLEDESGQNIHRGFGRLWDFLNACGSHSDHESGVAFRERTKSKQNQLLWFQVSSAGSLRPVSFFSLHLTLRA